MRRLQLVATSVLVLGVSTFLVGRSMQASPDPITEWSLAASEAGAANGMAPLRVPITLAILHLAMYDAVNAVTGEREPYAVTAQVVSPALPEAAAIEAGYRVLLHEFPGQASRLQSIYTRLLSPLTESQARNNGVAVGAEIARRFLEKRANDRRNATVPYQAGTGASVWAPTAPAFLAADTAFLAHVLPFTMKDTSQFRPAGPPPLDSKKWADEYNEVKALGARNSATRTPQQTATAHFWSPLAGTVWPATIHRIAREQALDLASSAHFQTAAFAAFADGLIACWDAKFHFNYWRPITAIRNGDADGNPNTQPDSAWEPLAVTPNFPEYPSGHACASAAAAHAIEDYFPRGVQMTARHVATGEERVFSKAAAVVDEVVEARMLIGVHFRSADEDGAEIGRRIAAQIRRDWFKRRR
jgi:hypothetical protein